VPTSAFGQVLRQLRIARGLTQEELADRARLSVRGISDLERGVKLAPRSTTLRLLANALDADPRQSAELFAAAARAKTQGPATGGTYAKGREQARLSGPLLKIQFARRSDGATTAYGFTGDGPVLMVPPGHMSHLD
jgi:transcriptional regulator with XRE-family HTH domain